MMSRRKRLVSVAIAAGALSTLHTQPASATGFAGGVFTGTATLAPMGWPVLTAPQTGSFSFSLTGAGFLAGTQVAGPLLSVQGSGSLGPGLVGGAWCGSTGGVGTSTITLNGPAGALAVNGSTSWLQSAGGLYLATGTAAGSASLVAVIDAIEVSPALRGQSCLNRTASTYDVVGVAVVAVP